ncbi:cytochrome-c peroxidase [Schlesneria paludicola]|uniref:cytochrome-c peroxidase n=1 Tax=Schlesneria paludicola TaxID=360056 RepID=UPI000299F464|nr:cytochrome c peroxidase [Schlesneria paludicola]
MITSSVGSSPVLNQTQNANRVLRPTAEIIRFSEIVAAIFFVFLIAVSAGHAQDLSPIEQLGKELFFDTNLSVPAGQACASCHAPETGFTGPSSDVNQQTGVYPGAEPSRFGNRKPPSVAYMSFSQKREYKKDDETWVGGQFWDGRADDLIAQAKGPFLNPLEMNNASAADVVNKVRRSNYRDLFDRVFGKKSLDTQASDTTFDQIARAIAAYESSREVNPFNSKYDAFLAKRVKLTPQEQRGLRLFADKANCTACHPHEMGQDGSPPLFTDFTYDNLGAPRNEKNPFYRAPKSVNADGAAYRDLGIGASVNDPAHYGKVKVPTLRNIAKKPSPDFVKCYLHNGTFKSLKEVVHFYNKRDQDPDHFPPADVPETVNHKELGNLGLTDEEEDDLIAFLGTLSDISIPRETPEPFQPMQPLFTKQAYRGVLDIQRVEKFRMHVIQASGKKDAARR